MFIELTILGFGHRPRPFNPEHKHVRQVNMDYVMSFGRELDATGLLMKNETPWWVEESMEEILARVNHVSSKRN